ncbi:MAG: hypothetical protein TREMPRED_001065 [Tremellales sp. Tagirdzhanova-0007]|nr:MAG: hypothetical protein TREMPRED_001065 [Tremellales sp. Tagirdzhanova-0007]
MTSTFTRRLSFTPISRTKAALQSSPETPNPIDLLTKIGRNADKRLVTQAESWDKLSEIWLKGGTAMEAAGLGPKDRRYILWAFAKYSQGRAPSQFIRSPKAPKKFRGRV